MFHDGARPLDVAQVAILLGWTKDAVRAACDRGELAHDRDHLNAYRIPCLAVASAARSRAKDGQQSPSGVMQKMEKPLDPDAHGLLRKP